MGSARVAPVVLANLDGWGYRQEAENNAIKHAMNRGMWIIGYQEETDQKFLLD